MSYFIQWPSNEMKSPLMKITCIGVARCCKNLMGVIVDLNIKRYVIFIRRISFNKDGKAL